ncbi:MAG: nicotinate phosphoribosyltransferase [Vicinamibacterales bacterium]
MQPALLTDFYELTMMQAYFEHGMLGRAVFEFFVRDLPDQRNFLVAAGLEQVLDYLSSVHMTDEELGWLRASGRFKPAFVDSLAGLRFTGDVDAMPEGSVFFGDEPILRVIAPLPEAQLVESRVMNLLHFQSMIASKAARAVLAAPERVLVDFGLRRAHGAEAGLFSARASWLAGFSGTATVEAGRQFGIPLYGTMAHSYVQAHADERDAFERFARSQPENAVLLIDTYDTERGAQRVVELAGRLAADGITIKGVRIDSGDLAALASRVRGILDEGGCQAITIFASGSLTSSGCASWWPRRRHRRVRDRHADEHVRRSSLPGLRLQAPEMRGRGAPQAFGREGDLAGAQAGLAAPRRGPPHGGRHPGPRGRRARG